MVIQFPFDLIEYCQQKNILVEAYSPTAHDELFKNEEVIKVAEKHNVSVPQLAIRYCLEIGLLQLAKTANRKNMKSNSEVDFTIPEKDMEALKNVDNFKEY